MVFLFHYFILSGGQPEWLPGVAGFGWTGVDLFFVLSGFLIASQLFSKIKATGQFSTGEFYFKRAFRILPAFLATVGIYFLIPVFREKEALPPLWKFITFTQNLGLNLKDYGTFSHAWSLCVEEHFYFILPLILAGFLAMKSFINSWWLLASLFFCGILLRFFCYENLYLPFAGGPTQWVIWYKQIYYPTYNRLDGLLTGVGIAALYQFRPALFNSVSKYGNLLMIPGLTMLTVAYFLSSEQMSFASSVLGFTVVSIGYGFIVAGAISPGSILYRLKSRITTFIATASYAIYLTHKGIIHLTHHYTEALHPDANLLLLFCIVTSIIGACLLHFSVERPFMRLREIVLRKHRSKAGSVHNEVYQEFNSGAGSSTEA